MAQILKGKVAIITGGTKGIGRATSQALAKLGASVAVNYASDSASANSLVSEIGEQNALAIQADAGSIQGVEHIVDATVKKFGKIDIVIPNAGVMPMKTNEATTESDFDRIYAVNVKGPYFLVQKAVPHMQAGSHIVFLSTTLNYASTVAPGYLLYCSTKGAIDQITKILAKELGPKNIAVNAVAPGPTATELFLKGKSEQMLEAIGKSIPRGRIGEPDEIADAIAFLCSPASRWVTGQTLPVNGGMASK